MPKDENIRKQWIDSISEHQSVDIATINFSVCSLHFRAEDVHKTNSRITVNTYPTIFPQTNVVSDRNADDSDSFNSETVTDRDEK